MNCKWSYMKNLRSKATSKNRLRWDSCIEYALDVQPHKIVPFSSQSYENQMPNPEPLSHDVALIR